MIRTQIYLPATLYKSVKARARVQGESAAQVIRELVQQGLTVQRTDATQRRSIGSIAKDLDIKEGPRDLSRRIDDYLYASEE